MSLINFNDPNSHLNYALNIDYLITVKILEAEKKFKSEISRISNLIEYIKNYSFLKNKSVKEILNDFPEKTFESLFEYFQNFSENLSIDHLFEIRENLRASNLSQNEIEFIDKHVEPFYFTTLIDRYYLPWDLQDPPDFKKIDLTYHPEEIKTFTIQNYLQQRLTQVFRKKVDSSNITNILEDSLKFFIDPNNTQVFFNTNPFYFDHSLIQENLNTRKLIIEFLINRYDLTQENVLSKEIDEFLGDDIWKSDLEFYFQLFKEFILYHEYFHKDSFEKNNVGENPYSLLNLFSSYDAKIIDLLFNEDKRINEFCADYYASKKIEEKYNVKNIIRTRYGTTSLSEHKNKIYYKNYDIYFQTVMNRLPDRIKNACKDNGYYFPFDGFWEEVDQEMARQLVT